MLALELLDCTLEEKFEASGKEVGGGTVLSIGVQMVGLPNFKLEYIIYSIGGCTA